MKRFLIISPSAEHVIEALLQIDDVRRLSISSGAGCSMVDFSVDDSLHRSASDRFAPLIDNATDSLVEVDARPIVEYEEPGLWGLQPRASGSSASCAASPT